MPDRKVRLSGYLPAAEMDGFQPLLDALVDAPKERRVVLGVVDVQTRRDHGDGEWEPTMRFLQVELPQGDLADQARDLLARAYSARTGAMQMFQDDDSNWGVGGQAGEPLTPEDSSSPLVGDQADEDAEWDAAAPDDELEDLQQQEDEENEDR